MQIKLNLPLIMRMRDISLLCCINLQLRRSRFNANSLLVDLWTNYGGQERKDNLIKNTSGEKWTSGIFKATNSGLRQQLHLSIGHGAVICFRNVLLPVVLRTTLKSNCKMCGNFVWLDMHLTYLWEESIFGRVFGNLAKCTSLHSSPLILNSGEKFI